MFGPRLGRKVKHYVVLLLGSTLRFCSPHSVVILVSNFSTKFCRSFFTVVLGLPFAAMLSSPRVHNIR